MQKAALLIESIMIWVLLGMVMWHRYQRTLKRWWNNWRAKPQRSWRGRPGHPMTARTAGWPSGRETQPQPGTTSLVGGEAPAGATEGAWQQRASVHEWTV